MVEKHLTEKLFLRKHLEAVIHVLALLQYWFFIEFGLGSSWESLPEYLVYYVFMCLPIVFYANAFWLIPSFLRRKRWLVFVLLAMLLFFGTMIRTAIRLPRDFGRLYRRARWLGICAGVFGFPILTIPAAIGVWRLSKYHTLTAGEPERSEIRP